MSVQLLSLLPHQFAHYSDIACCCGDGIQGDTRLYDAIKQGTTMLQAFHARFPTAKRRLLVLSDGEDSCSEAKAFQVHS